MTYKPPWGEPYAVKCLHVAEIRATAVSLVFFRRPFCTPRTYAAPISPVLRGNQYNAILPNSDNTGNSQEWIFSIILFDAAPSQFARKIQYGRE